MWVRLLPGAFFLSYLNVTVLMFIFGPWEYPIEADGYLYAFLGIAHLALLAGYLSGAFKQPKTYNGQQSVPRLVVLSLVVSFAVIIPTSMSRTGQVIPDLIGILTDPGGAYNKTVDLMNSGNVALVEYLRFFLGPIMSMLLPLLVFYWQTLSRGLRCWAAVAVFAGIATSVSTGVNKALADFAVVSPWLVIAGILAGKIVISWGKLCIFGIGAGGVFVGFLMFFGSTQSTREGSAAMSGYCPPLNARADMNNIMVRDLTDDGQVMVLGLIFYMTHGYYAVDLALHEPFIPMFGVGHTEFLTRQASRILNNRSLEELSYTARLEKYGIDHSVFWSSLYPWIASDVSFFGTPFILFLIGRAFALTWIDALEGTNPFAVVMFSQLVITFYYMSCNNQNFASGESFSAFWVGLFLWCRSRGVLVPSPRPEPSVSLGDLIAV